MGESFLKVCLPATLRRDLWHPIATHRARTSCKSEKISYRKSVTYTVPMARLPVVYGRNELTYTVGKQWGCGSMRTA